MRRAVVVVTGPPGGGKTTALLGLARGLAAAGRRVGGIVQPALHEGGARVGYELLDVATGARRPLARRTGTPQEHGCGFAFAPDAFAWAAARLDAAHRDGDVLVADELGRLEAAGHGHLPALVAPVAPDRTRLWLLGVRQDVLGMVAARLGPFTLVIEAAMDLAAVAERLLTLAAPPPGGDD
jgi:nucleoside-triphosphatase THEP1